MALSSPPQGIRRDSNDDNDDDNDSDAYSVDLLADSPPPKVKTLAASHGTKALSSSSPVVSPATRTINQLSQPTTDLHYDMSQLDYDVAHILKGRNESSSHGGGNHDNDESLAASVTSSPLRPRHASRNKGDPKGSPKDSSSFLPVTSPVNTKTQRKESNRTEPKRRAASTSPSLPRRTRESPKRAAKVAATTTTTTLQEGQVSVKLSQGCRSQPVEQIDLQSGRLLRTFPSLREVQRHFGMTSRHALKRVLNGQQESMKGFGWRYCTTTTMGAVTKTLRQGKTKKNASCNKKVAPVSRRSSSSSRAKAAKPQHTPLTCRNHTPLPETNSLVERLLRDSPAKTRRQKTEIARMITQDGRPLTRQVSKTIYSQMDSSSNDASPSLAKTRKRKNVPANAETAGLVPAKRSRRLTKTVVATACTRQAGSSEKEPTVQTTQRDPVPAQSCRSQSMTTKLTRGKGSQKKQRPSEPKGPSKSAKQVVTEEEEGASSAAAAAAGGGSKDSNGGRKVAAMSKGQQKQRSKSTKPNEKSTESCKADMDIMTAKSAATEQSNALEMEILMASKTGSQMEDLPFGNYRILRFDILSPGTLGMDIELYNVPIALKAELKDQEGFNLSVTRGCMVRCVEQDGQAHTVGLRPGDFFVEEAKTLPGKIALRDYNDVKEAALSGTRPLILFAARRKVDFGEFVSKASQALSEMADMSEVNSGDAVVDLSSSIENRANVNDTPGNALGYRIPHAPSNENVHPFCSKCSNPSLNIRAHHPWCPKHEHFHLSGGDEILEELERGLAVNCKTCREEYTSGRVKHDGVHGLGCSRRSPAHTTRPRTEEKKKVSAKVTANNPAKTSKKGRAIRPTPKFRGAADFTSLAASEDESEISVFDSPTKPKSKEQKAAPTTTNKSRHGQTAHRKESDKQAKKSTSKKGTKGSAGNMKTNKMENRCSGKEVSRQSFGGETLHFGDEVSYCGDDETLEASWEASENPWGLDSFQDGDVVVFAPSRPVEEQESALLSERFAHDPFSTYARYSRSHKTPEEGLHTLVLNRDLLQRTPWGFSVYRHEFGGACLVHDVVPMSPAFAATFVGVTSEGPSQGLAVNDMILAIDGKITAGMTTVEFEVELELAGPTLLLTVSRFKANLLVKKQVVQQEQLLLDRLNDMYDDDKHLGWIDYVKDEVAGRSSPADTITGLHAVNIPPYRVSSFQLCTGTPQSSELSLRKQVAELRRSPRNDATKAGHTETDKHVSKISLFPESHTRNYNSPASGHSAVDKDSTPQVAARKVNQVSTERKNARLAKRVSGSPYSSDLSSAKEEEWSDDGNCWNGCVCGAVHGKGIPVFWVQCDHCQSWYNVAKQCVLMSEEEAKDLDKWLCWACEVPTTDGSDVKVEVPEGHRDTYKHCKGATHVEGLQLSFQFKKGDTVDVREHGWPGVSNPEGIATILDAYNDEDGDKVYDLKYIVGDKKKGVLEEYLSLHRFSE